MIIKSQKSVRLKIYKKKGKICYFLMVDKQGKEKFVLIIYRQRVGMV